MGTTDREFTMEDAEEIHKIEQSIQQNMSPAEDDEETKEDTCSSSLVSTGSVTDISFEHEGAVSLTYLPENDEDEFSERFPLPHNDDQNELQRLCSYVGVDVGDIHNLLYTDVPIKQVEDGWLVEVPPVKSTRNYAVYGISRFLRDKLPIFAVSGKQHVLSDRAVDVLTQIGKWVLLAYVIYSSWFLSTQVRWARTEIPPGRYVLVLVMCMTLIFFALPIVLKSASRQAKSLYMWAFPKP